jgi:Flp pilus assembly protein TadG
MVFWKTWLRKVAENKRTLMRSIREDVRGSTTLLVAAAMLPMVGVIGCGVDMSRAYLAKTRLQQACDAGVLGGRKVMTTNGVDATVTAEVQKFVNYDFPQGTLGTDTFPIAATAGANNSVDLTLSTTLPTVMMRVFGTTSIPITASCTARQDFVNTDVVLALDTTLSMNCLPSESATAYCSTEKSGSKIQALRAAVTAFYNALKPAQDELESQGLRLRYGIVPFSETVSVGKLLRATDTSWVNDTWKYDKCTVPSSKSITTQCTTFVKQSVGPRTAAFWTSWDGCIEERQTVNSIDLTSGYTPPTSAYDLDADLIPNSPETRWNVYDVAAETARSAIVSPGIDSACPKAAQQIQRVADVAAMNTYTTSMKAGGYTYLDIGMLWGARLLAPNGLWAGNNPTTFNNFPVNRHLILFTDGYIEPEPNTYSAYGVERLDKRVTGNGNAQRQTDSHTQRFRMLCNTVKGMNVNVWVVSFGAGSTLTPDLVNCASSPAQAFKADDQAGLVAKFTEIGEAIGALRLSR